MHNQRLFLEFRNGSDLSIRHPLEIKTAIIATNRTLKEFKSTNRPNVVGKSDIISTDGAVSTILLALLSVIKLIIWNVMLIEEQMWKIW